MIEMEVLDDAGGRNRNSQGRFVALATCHRASPRRPLKDPSPATRNITFMTQ